jgi:hypothetical protein
LPSAWILCSSLVVNHPAPPINTRAAVAPHAITCRRRIYIAVNRYHEFTAFVETKLFTDLIFLGLLLGVLYTIAVNSGAGHKIPPQLQSHPYALLTMPQLTSQL